MLFHRKPAVAEYALLSGVYDLNDHGEGVPLMTRQEAVKAARYFLAAVDNPEATAQVVNTNNSQTYTVRRLTESLPVYLVTWLNGRC